MRAFIIIVAHHVGSLFRVFRRGLNVRVIHVFSITSNPVWRPGNIFFDRLFHHMFDPVAVIVVVIFAV